MQVRDVAVRLTLITFMKVLIWNSSSCARAPALLTGALTRVSFPEGSDGRIFGSAERRECAGDTGFVGYDVKRQTRYVRRL